MWYRSFYSCLLICGLSIVGMDAKDACGQQDTASNGDAFAKVLKNEVRGLSQTSIDEIIEIRKRLGGGTGLETSDLVELTQTGWKRESLSNSKGILDHQKPTPKFATTPSEKLFFEMLQSIPDLSVKRSNLATTVDGKSDRITDIRATARRIDELAAELEELELFGDADELRTLASSIRKKARPVSRSAGTNRQLR